jgi:transposase
VDPGKKQGVMDWLATIPQRGSKKEASAKFGLSYPTINNWANSVKSGVSEKTKKQTESPTPKLITNDGKKYIPLASAKSMGAQAPKELEKDIKKLAVSLAKIAEKVGVNLRRFV